jgi:hypothetical protein
MLKRALGEKGIKASTERKSHRSDDLFDFQVSIDGKPTRLDLKTNNYFSDYALLGREPLSSQLIAANASYPGPEWGHFFPMLVPHTQIGQEKNAYCFAFGSSIDFRKDLFTNRSADVLAAFPYGDHLPFLSSSKLCKGREGVAKGIYLSLRWDAGLLDPKTIKAKVLGEWDGKIAEASVFLKHGKLVTAGPFSVVASFIVDSEDVKAWQDGRITVSVKNNQFTTPVLNSARTNVNVQPKGRLEYQKEDFCNLVLPKDYKLYVVGWTTKDKFIEACRKYPGWVWPIDSASKWNNTSWTQITESDRNSITRAGFENCIQDRPRGLHAGWMKTNGRGGGACCYVYPNIGMNGGVKETNLYVLPQDMNTVSSLG